MADANDFRAKTYANRADKAENKVGHVQVSGTVEAFSKLVKGDKDSRAMFDKAVSEALKA